MTLLYRDGSRSRYYETNDVASDTSLPRIIPQSPSRSLARYATASTIEPLRKRSVTEVTTRDGSIAASMDYRAEPPLLPNSASSLYTLSTSETYPYQNAAALPPRNFDLQYEFLQMIEPRPVEPPSYDSLVPGGCPRFPTYSNIPGALGHGIGSLDSCALFQLPESEIRIEPPPYSPSVYKLTVVFRKIEWLTPFEAAPVRRWKCFIMELNSTQLNFYLIPSALEEKVMNYFADPESRSLEVGARGYDDEIDVRKSGMTTDVDIKFYRMCRRLNLISNDYNNGGGRRLSVLRLRGTLNAPKHLNRSYSLQHATVGLATDYFKRKNVLRARLESEQLLLHFYDTQDLIDWEVALGVGTGIALDLVDRELPRFRTVPRRRRRRRGLSDMCEYTSGNFSTALSSRMTRRGLTGGAISGSFRSRMQGICSLFETSIYKQVSENQIRLPEANDANGWRRTEFAEAPTNYLAPAVGPIEESIDLDAASDDDDDYSIVESNLFAAASNELPDPPVSLQRTQVETPTGLGSQSIDASSTTQSWCDASMGSDKNENDTTQELLDDDSWIEESALSSYDTSKLINFKWDPLANLQPNKRKVHRNCLRCIRALSNYDPWVNKCVVKPTVISPFIFNYLNFMRTDPHAANNYQLKPNSRDRSSSGASMLTFADPDKSPHKMRAFRRLNIFAGKDRLQENGLARMPCHYVREYVVGSHVLIPKMLNV